MKGENLWTLVAGAVLGGGILSLAIIVNYNEIYLFILAGLIMGMAVAGVIVNRIEEIRIERIQTRRRLERKKNRSKLRREFRGTQLGDIISLPTYADPDDSRGFGNGTYEE